jgi:sn-glycerol 3-phosphate transport system permease protein
LAADKRIVFRSSWLPWVLLTPQLVVISVFFFWPAGQALVQSLQQSDAFGMSVVWVGLENFQNLYNDESYAESFLTTGIFSLWVAVLGISCLLYTSDAADD